jgi:DNA processing protein
MNWSRIKEDKSIAIPFFDLSELEPDEQKVVITMKDKNAPVMIDELAWRAELPHGLLASLLLTLEMKNIVQALPGKMFRLSIK